MSEKYGSLEVSASPIIPSVVAMVMAKTNGCSPEATAQWIADLLDGLKGQVGVFEAEVEIGVNVIYVIGGWLIQSPLEEKVVAVIYRDSRGEVVWYFTPELETLLTNSETVRGQEHQDQILVPRALLTQVTEIADRAEPSGIIATAGSLAVSEMKRLIDP